MENASKALLMAGGILLAVIIMGTFIYMFTNARITAETEHEIETVEQITKFNNQFESYNKKLMRGVEVISALNKAIDNNTKYERMELGPQFKNYEVIVNAYCLDDLGLKQILKYTSDKSKTEFTKFEQIKNENNEEFIQLKRKIFNCTQIKFNDIGRVCELKYEEIDVDQ